MGFILDKIRKILRRVGMLMNIVKVFEELLQCDFEDYTVIIIYYFGVIGRC